MSPSGPVLGLDHQGQALHRGDVGLLEAGQDRLELGAPLPLQLVELPQLPGEYLELLVDGGELGVRAPRAGWGRFCSVIGADVIAAGWAKCRISLPFSMDGVHRASGPKTYPPVEGEERRKAWKVPPSEPQGRAQDRTSEGSSLYRRFSSS